MSETTQQRWHAAVQQGIEAFNRGQFPAAIEGFRQATQLLPQAAAAWVNLCTVCLAAGDYPAALVAAERAVELEPHLAPAHLMRGDALRESGRPKEALQAYERAVNLQVTPLSLNKLACALREEKLLNRAEKLFIKALELAPDYPTAKINLITHAIVQQNMPLALERLTLYKQDSYPPIEKQQLQESDALLREYTRLSPGLDALVAADNRNEIFHLLSTTPDELLELDEALFTPIKAFAESAQTVTPATTTNAWLPPDNWAEIEALFMIPLIDSAESYLDFKRSDQANSDNMEIRESLNMVAAIAQARRDRQELQTVIGAEVCLRHWHALSTRGLEGFLPGHFKYSNNVLQTDITMPRASAIQTSQTFRRFISDCYLNLPPGLHRAALVLFAVIEIHPFVDGNGRSALIWLNRELEWAGLPPAVFSRPLGLQGELGKARRHVRRHPQDITPLVEAIQAGQALTLSLCQDLAESA